MGHEERLTPIRLQMSVLTDDGSVPVEAVADTGFMGDLILAANDVARIEQAGGSVRPAGMVAIQTIGGVSHVGVVRVQVGIGDEVVSSEALLGPSNGGQTLVGLGLLERLRGNTAVKQALIRLSAEQEGLALYFSTRLTLFDRFLVNGVVFGVLGPDADLAVEFRSIDNDNVVVRLSGAPPEDLEAVAEALWNRVWAMEQESELRALAAATGGLHVDLRAGFDSLVDRIDRMEHRLPNENAVERLDDLGGKYVKDKDGRLVRTWGQKAASVVGKRVVKTVLGEAEGAVVDGVKGLLPGAGSRGDEEAT